MVANHHPPKALPMSVLINIDHFQYILNTFFFFYFLWYPFSVLHLNVATIGYLRMRFTEFHLEQNVSSMYLTMDVCTDQQAISQDWPTENVFIDQQEISEEWPTKESFKRREILKWRNTSDDVYKIKKVSHRKGKFGNSAFITLKSKMEMNFLYGPLNALLKI